MKRVGYDLSSEFHSRAPYGRVPNERRSKRNMTEPINIETQYKEKFRPDESALDQEVDAALGGLSMEELYRFDKPTPGAAGAHRRYAAIHINPRACGGDGSPGSTRTTCSSISAARARASPRCCSSRRSPKVGEEIDFNVDRYDEREGLLILSRKGAAATNVSWENLEVGQIVEGTVTGMNKGGLELDVKGMRGVHAGRPGRPLLPEGHLHVHRPEDAGRGDAVRPRTPRTWSSAGGTSWSARRKKPARSCWPNWPRARPARGRSAT